MIQIHPRGFAKTVVVFSGMAPSNHVYEWTKSFEYLSVNLIGVKDPLNQWYQSSYENTLEHIRKAVGIMNTKFLLCLGGSAGGFAALSFGKALAADKIVAFCPQSACGQAKRDLGDKRWPEMCLSTPSADIAGEYPNAEIHVAYNDPLDMMHAERLQAHHCRWPSGGHDLPFALKANGNLQQILQEAIR